MKLLFCPLCADVRKLNRVMTECKCRESWGRYEDDGLHAIYGGQAVILGIANPDIAEAMRHPDHLVIRCWRMDPNIAPNIKRLDAKPVEVRLCERTDLFAKPAKKAPAAKKKNSNRKRNVVK